MRKRDLRRRKFIILATSGAAFGAFIYRLGGRSWLEVAGILAGTLIGLFIVLILWEYFRKRGTTLPKSLEKFRAKKLPVALKEKIYLSVGGLVIFGVAAGIALFLKGMGVPWPVLLLVFFGVLVPGVIVLNKIFGLTD